MGRPTRGSRLDEFYSELDSSSMKAVDGQIPSSLDSAFQLQEYISALVRADPHDVERIVKLPSKDERDKERDDVEIDEACWIYEQLRRLALDLTYPLVDMLQNTCNRRTCPEMKAGEWLYLCVAHGPSGAMEQCCAIDYIVHTIDSATALLNSPKAFPSRLSIPAPSRRHFPSLARRLGRIFAHAYFHHREGFAAAEAQNSLYARFLALCKRFELVPPEFLVIPLPQEEHADSTNSNVVENGHDRQPPQSVSVSPDAPNITILSRPSEDANAISNHANAGGHSPASSTSQSRSPRNRPRTDTMYLSGTFHEVNSGFAGANAGGAGDIETRRVSSPLAATLASQEEEDEKAALAQSIAQSSNAGPDGTITDMNETYPEQATLVTPPTVPIITSNAPSQILIRDFALEGSILSQPIPELTTPAATEIPTTIGLDPDVVTTTTISVPSTTHMVIPPIVVNAPEGGISRAGDGDDIASSFPNESVPHAHTITEVSAEDEDEENPDVDDLEHALENDDDDDDDGDDEEEEEGEEEGNSNVGIELPESDIASASAIEVRFEEIAPEPEPGQEQEQEGEVEPEHKLEEEVDHEHKQEEEAKPERKQVEEVEPEYQQEEKEVESEHANKLELDSSSSTSILEGASTEHLSESKVDELQASQDKAPAISHAETTDTNTSFDTDTTDIQNRDNEGETSAESFEASLAAQTAADVKPKASVEGSEQLDAEPVSNGSSISPEATQSQSASTDGSASNTTEPSENESPSPATTASSDYTSSDLNPPTNGEKKVEEEPEISSPVDSLSSETKASEH